MNYFKLSSNGLNNNNLLLVSNTEGKFVCIYISKQYKGDSLALLQSKENIIFPKMSIMVIWLHRRYNKFCKMLMLMLWYINHQGTLGKWLAEREKVSKLFYILILVDCCGLEAVKLNLIKSINSSLFVFCPKLSHDYVYLTSDSVISWKILRWK